MNLFPILPQQLQMEPSALSCGRQVVIARRKICGSNFTFVTMKQVRGRKMSDQETCEYARVHTGRSTVQRLGRTQKHRHGHRHGHGHGHRHRHRHRHKHKDKQRYILSTFWSGTKFYNSMIQTSKLSSSTISFFSLMVFINCQVLN